MQLHYRAVWINLPLSIFAVSLCALCGCVIYAFYADCDPISNKQIRKGDQVMSNISYMLNVIHKSVPPSDFFFVLQEAFILFCCCLDPAIFCDARVRIVTCHTWLIYGLFVQWDSEVCF